MGARGGEGLIKVLRALTRLNVGGPAQHAVFLTERLQDGEFVSLLAAGEVNRDEGDMGWLAERHGVRVFKVPYLRNDAGRLDDLRAFLGLVRLCRREAPDIAHFHTFKDRVLGATAARVAGVPVIAVTYHGTPFRGHFTGVKGRAVLAADRFVGRHLATAVIAISERQRDELVELRVAPPERVRVVRIGLDLEPLLSVEGLRGELRRELGVSLDTVLIGAVGRLAPVKRLEILLAAAQAVVGAAPRPVHFVLVGDGRERPRLERRARELGIEGHVSFLGWRHDLRRVYADLDMLALSSASEGTPACLLEGLAAAVPAVATSVGGVPDIVEDGVTGLLVPPHDPEALARALLRLAGDEELRRQLGAQGRKFVFPAFDVGTLERNMRALYRELGRRNRE